MINLPKDPEKMTESEKEIFTFSLLQSFATELNGPNDIFKQILLEETFKFLLEGEEFE